MSDGSMNLTDVFGLIRRNLLLAILVMGICGGLGFAAVKYLPKKYKAKAILNIQAGYFQNPLVSDLFPQVNDAGEQSAQRLSLLRLALTPEFLDDLASRNGIYKAPPGSPLRLMEREFFLKSIEYYPENATTFQIAAIAEAPAKSFQLTTAILNQMVKTLNEERRKGLNTMKQALEGYVTSLNAALKGSSDAAASIQPDSLSTELKKIRTEIESLTLQYTDRHPEVLRLKEKEKLLRRIYAAATQNELFSLEDRSMGINSVSRAPTQEVYAELVKKLNLLNVVLEMERGTPITPYLMVIEKPVVPVWPVFPDPKKIALISLVGGMLCTGVAVMFVEMRRGSFLSPRSISKALAVPLLGELPRLRGVKRLGMLEVPGPTALRLTLPSPIAEE